MDNDRRKYLRFDIPMDVEFKSPGESVSYLAGTIKNFSREGLLLVAPDACFGTTSALELKINLPGKSGSYPASGDIIWMDKIQDKLHMGIRLRQIDSEVKGEILDLAYVSWLDNMRRPKNS